MKANQQPDRGQKFLRASARQRRNAAIVFVVLAVISVFFWLAATERIDITNMFDPCGLKQQYDLPCPTCGMTTSSLAFARGQILKAFHIQPAGAFLCCVMIASVVLAFIIAVFGIYFNFLQRFFNEVKIRYMILTLILIIAMGWAIIWARALK